jgi:hypothetical protein
MKRVIHKYLDRAYRINNGFIQELSNSKYIIIYSDEIIKNLELIFPLTPKQLKWYIKSWTFRQSKNFNFKYWWSKKITPYIYSRTITSGTRTLTAAWTPELAQDLEFFHNIDAEAELTAMIQQEIDRYILNQVINYNQMSGVPN